MRGTLRQVTRIVIFASIVSLRDVFESFTLFMEIFGTCDPVVHTEGNTVNDNKIVIVSLLFYGCKVSLSH